MFSIHLLTILICYNCLKPYLSYMQAGGFKLPFLVVGGCIVILMLLLVVLVRPTGTYFPW